MNPRLEQLGVVAISLLVIRFIVAPRIRRWYRRSLLKCSQLHDSNVLRYPDYIVPVMWASGIFFGATMIMVVVSLLVLYYEIGFARTLPVALPLLVAGAASAWFVRQSIFMLSSFSTESFLVTSTGLEFNTLPNGHGRFRWSDVVRIRYPGPGWIKVVATDNTVVWVSLSLCHLSTFARTALDEVAPDAISWRTQRCLRQTSTWSP